MISVWSNRRSSEIEGEGGDKGLDSRLRVERFDESLRNLSNLT